jgi:hypothetical protein
VASRLAALIQSPLFFGSKVGGGAVCTLTLPRGIPPPLPNSWGVQV